MHPNLWSLCPSRSALLPAVPSSESARWHSSFHQSLPPRSSTNTHRWPLCAPVPQYVCLAGQGAPQGEVHTPCLILPASQWAPRRRTTSSQLTRAHRLCQRNGHRLLSTQPRDPGRRASSLHPRPELRGARSAPVVFSLQPRADSSPHHTVSISQSCGLTSQHEDGM